MTLGTRFPFSSSYKIHILVGLILGFLLGFILIVLQPFNINNFNHNYGEVLLIGFGFVKFINYMLAHFTENYYYRKKRNWTWWNEINFHFISSVSGTILGYIYLDAVFQQQPITFFSFLLFFFYLVLPILPLVIFPQIVLRYLLIKNSTKHAEQKKKEIENQTFDEIILKGENATDVLNIKKDNLLYVKSVGNYVMIYYKDSQLKSKMLRATLSEILTQAHHLIQPHRSYLVNPNKPFKVKGNSQKAALVLSLIEDAIPISRASFKTVKELFN